MGCSNCPLLVMRELLLSFLDRAALFMSGMALCSDFEVDKRQQ
jgi:hypothetical protein